MEVQKYAVIGHPIGHTMSPFIHKRLFELDGIKAQYTAIDISPEMLKDEFNSTLKALDGYNVTSPHKERIIPLLNNIDKAAQLCNSVNTVNNHGTATGYTTDGHGFYSAISTSGIILQNNSDDETVVILGCGGAARAIAFECAAHNCGEITFAVRAQSINKGNALACELNAKTGANACVITFDELQRLERTITLLINATVVGMYPSVDFCPVDDNVIKKCQAVFDAVYNPLETMLIKKAQKHNIRAVNGMSMLVYQAALSHSIWACSTYDIQDIDKICKQADNYLRNL